MTAKPCSRLIAARPTEVVERSEAKAKGPWSGLWYVNVGEGPHRSWEDMRRYKFIGAGGGEKYSGPLSRLQPGNRIVAYQKRRRLCWVRHRHRALCDSLAIFSPRAGRCLNSS